MPEGNSPTSNDQLNTLHKTSANMSAFIFIIFVGISESWDALETSRFKISLSTSDFGIYLKENCLAKLLSFIATILGWFLYCSIIRKIGSSMWSVSTDGSTNGRIFKFKTTLVKKLLKVSAILSLFSQMELSSIKVILLDLAFFSDNSGLTCFQKDLLSIIFLQSRLL